MILRRQAIAIPVCGYVGVKSLGDALHISVEDGEDIVFIPSLNKTVHYSAPDRVFLTRDYGPIAVNAASSHIRITSVDPSVSFAHMRLNCLDVAVGKTYIAALYKNRVSIISFNGDVISEIPLGIDISREVSNRPLRSLSPIYDDKAFLSCRRGFVTRMLIAVDIRKGTITNVLTGNTLSYDGRYAVELMYAGAEEDVSRLIMRDIDGNVVFNDIVHGKICDSNVGDYLIIRYGYSTPCNIVDDVKGLRSIVLFASSVVITNDGYIGAITDSKDPAHKNKIVHIFHINSIPYARWGAFRTSALCVFGAEVSATSAIKIGSDRCELAKDDRAVGAGLCL